MREATWPIVRALVILVASLALVAWLMSMAVGSFGPLDAAIQATMAPQPQPRESGGFEIIDDAPSVCCDDFVAGGRTFIWVMALGGLPAAVVAMSLALLTRRREWQWPASSGPWIQACFVLQLSAALIAGLMVLAFEPWEWGGLLSGLIVYLIVSCVASLLALAAWRIVGATIEAPASSRVLLLLPLLLVTLSSDAFAQDTRNQLRVNFTASADQFRDATNEYRDIWAKEGPRIVAAMEKISGLTFEPGPIDVSIYEGTSYAGERGGRPMFLRASYPEPTKRGTLVHELGHRLAADVPFKGDHHELIFLFVYDVWVDLWGRPFADEQVAIESKRSNQFTDYAGNWKKALAMSTTERASRLQQIVSAKGQ